MAIDHVLDCRNNTVREVELLQVEADGWMQRMAKELAQGADSLAKGLACFAAGRARAVRRTVQTRDAQRRVEDFCRDALENMFQGEAYDRLMDNSTPSAMGGCLDFVVTRIKRREVYRHLSNASDRLAHAGEAPRDISTKQDEGRSKSMQ